jgi:hypothetical protein
MKFIENDSYNSKLDKGNIAQSTTVEHFKKYAEMVEEIGIDKDK